MITPETKLKFFLFVPFREKGTILITVATIEVKGARRLPMGRY